MDVSIWISMVAAGFSFVALVLTVLYRKVDARAWLVIKELKLSEENDYIRIVAVVNHASGGAALNIKYKFSISDNDSGFTQDSSAIFQGQEVYLNMPLIKGWKPSKEDEITFVIKFNDMYGYKYEIAQVMRIDGNQLSYKSSEKRTYRNLWLNI